jgi:dihydrolipoamide dehydrogenase
MSKKITIIGSGPGGYVAAIRASQLGFAVTVVERSELGGVCLNWGCIPTKSLLKSAEVLNYTKNAAHYGIDVEGTVTPNFEKVIQRSRQIASQMSKGIEYLFTKNAVNVIKGTATIKDHQTVTVKGNDGVDTKINSDYIILATGARSRSLPSLPIDGKTIIGYKEALCLSALPKTMLVVGSGAIGVEMAYFYASMGTQVTIVEYMPSIVPLLDQDVSDPLERSLKKLKVKVLKDSEVLSVAKNELSNTITIKTPKGEIDVEAEIILSAVGIEANCEGLGLSEIGVEIQKGKIVVDSQYKTTIVSIYAIGDIIATPALAHVASAEALACVELLAGHNKKAINYQAIPSCIYTSPEISSVGLTENQLKQQNIPYTIGKFPFSALGKATAVGARDGFVKLIFDAATNKLLGAHMVGYNVTEMLSEIVVSLNLGATAHDLLESIHPHPTMSEAIMEAAAVACGEAIHL